MVRGVRRAFDIERGNEMRKQIAMVTAVVASLMAAAEGYDLKSLVDPITFSCELRDVRLTRVIDKMSTGQTNVDRENETFSTRHTISSTESSSAEHMAGVATSQRDEEGHRTERQFNVGGGVKWGLIPTGKVGGEYTRTGSADSRRTTDITVSGKGGIENKSSTGSEQTSSRGKDRTTETIDESFVGSYRLDFSVVLRNLDSTDRLTVEGSKMRARLTGDALPGPVTVKYEERGDFSLGAEETICPFTYPIEDLKMLKALLRLDREGMLGQLQLSKSGADIVVMSEKTGRNVLSDMNAVEKYRPGTIFFVEFGEELAMHPEWRVSRRHSAKSGPRGSRVNMREALLAIQGAAVDKNEVLPEVVFTFADDGALSKVVDRPLVDKDNEGRYRMFALRLTKTNGETEVCLPNAEIMKAEISNYSKVALFSFDLDEFARMSLLHPQYFSRLSKEVAKYLDGFSDKKAYEFYNKALNNVDTWVQVGICYMNGKGVEQDKKEAAKWYRKAAEQGNADVQVMLGVCYANGDGVVQDKQEAVKWFRMAAEQGEARAQCNLGVCYERGDGVAQDEKEAVKWYRKAAEQGDARAQCNLGFCYSIEDKQEAAKWYRKAAEQGDARAQFLLGGCYYDGEGVTQNKKEAVRWIRKAAEQGFEPARQALRVL